MDYKTLYEYKPDLIGDDGVDLTVRYSIDTKEIFEPEIALAVLLMERKIMLNSHWWEKDWPKEARKKFAIAVICNDVFYYASADAESIDYLELKDAFMHWEKDNDFGLIVWAIKKRKQKPIPEVYKSIMDEGIWNLDEMELK